jgi:hypothetical protein
VTASTPPTPGRPAFPTLDESRAAAFAEVALGNVDRPLPHKLDHLLTAGAGTSAADHVALHPAFYGSFDWHSSVHMHWLLVRILRVQPGVPAAPRIVARLDAHLAPERIAQERAYCAGPAGATFERPYGWAWLLELRAELERLAAVDRRARGWADAVDPFANDLATRLAAFATAAPYPIRSGVHSCTAFALTLALDHARTCAAPGHAAAYEAAARRWHAADRDAPLAWEPSLTDFLSPSLAVVMLMREVLDPREFATWLRRFLPQGIGPLAAPPVVADRHDAQITHLDGLALSRAWMLRRIASGLAEGHPLRAEVLCAAERNLAAGLPHSVGGDYVGEHWLASFAALALGDKP